MEIKNKDTFAFLVLVYNQEQYIIEHLESIKYLIIKYAKDIEVDLLINDDFSRDNSTKFIDCWLEHNEQLFRSIIKIYNTKNLGTSKSVYNLLKLNTANKCKITAADDVYSFENIFIPEAYSRNIAIQSGFPITLIDEELSNNNFSNFLQIASYEIYKKSKLLNRFKHFSLNNAPNMFYEVRCLQNINVLNFLQTFDVIEDWPIQLQITREFPNLKFELIDKVFVYYRRTLGSTYIVANNRFIADKTNIYNDLLKSEDKYFEKLRLYIRKLCFVSQNKLVNIVLNIDFYIFMLKILFNFNRIVKKFFKLNLNFELHQIHYRYIKELSAKSKLLFRLE